MTEAETHSVTRTIRELGRAYLQANLADTEHAESWQDSSHASTVCKPLERAIAAIVGEEIAESFWNHGEVETMVSDYLEGLERPHFSTHGGIVKMPSLWGKYERFAEFGPHGFRVNLPNGNTVSVQWGPWNYCDNRHGPIREVEKFAAESRPYTSNDAEVAAWREVREGETPYREGGSSIWHNFSKDSHVRGWMSPEEVLEFIDFAASNELDTRKWSYDWDLDEYVLIEPTA